MAADDEPKALLVLLALATALWLAGQILASPETDPGEPGGPAPVRDGVDPSPTPLILH